MECILTNFCAVSVLEVVGFPVQNDIADMVIFMDGIIKMIDHSS